MICQQYLPLITNQILYLHLEDCAETPGWINLFFSSIPSIRSFTNLRRLKLCHVSSHSVLMKIFNELDPLSNLTYLSFDSCYYGYHEIDLQLIVNKLWNLPKLNYIRHNIYFKYKQIVPLPTNISPSIQTLYFYRRLFTYDEFKQLYQYTPYLKNLRIRIVLNTYEHVQSYQLLSLTCLYVCIAHLLDTSKIILFLQNLPNLCQLQVLLYANIINGHQWEQLIENYLPKLKRFELDMKEQRPVDQNIEERTDQLLNSFQSSFWIDKHKWFVRCFVDREDIYVQTVSMTFYPFGNYSPCSWKSTVPNDDSKKLYSKITHLTYSICCNPSILSSVCVENITTVSIKFPIHDQFWSAISSLPKLRSLTVFSYNDSSYVQLQTLLDYAPNLINLTIDQYESLSLQTFLSKCTNTSVPNLYFRNNNQEFNKEECLALSQSSLGKQCEILSVHNKNCQSIMNLIENMNNLTALHIQYGKRVSNIPLSANDTQMEISEEDAINMDETIQWLKDHLPSTYFISKNFILSNHFRIWIK